MVRFWVVFIFFLINATFASANLVVQIHLDGVINNGTTKYVVRAVEYAQQKNADFLAIRLNTPGGLLNSTRDIVSAMNASKVPIGVFIGPGGASATSAGTIIAMAANVSGMAPGTNIGAAHPVAGQGQDIKGDMGEKAVNDTVAFIQSQAQLRGRNVQWAEQAIRKSASLAANDAVAEKVVDFVADDFDSFVRKAAEKIGKPFQMVPIEHLEMTKAERVLHFLGDPNVSYMLMVLGGVGLYAEMSSPGLVFPGVVGALCLVLSLISFSTLPVNTGAVALLILAVVFFILEAFITSYGLLAVAGIVSMLLGGLFLMDSSTGDLRLSLALLIPVVLAFGSIMLIIGYMFRRESRGRASLELEGQVAEIVALSPSAAHSTAHGRVQLRGEFWDFRWQNEPRKTPAIGTQVRIKSRDQFLLIVEEFVP